MAYFDNPKQRYKRLLIIILPIFVALIVMLFLSYNSVLKSFGSNSTISGEKKYTIELMDYMLRSNATDYQIEIFKELENAVNDNDEQKIVEGVAKNYIADIYTWTNKNDKWDVGGMCYVYSRYKTTIYYELRDTLYEKMAEIKREHEKELLEIKSVEVLNYKKNNEFFEIEGKQYQSYSVTCSFELSGYQNTVALFTKRQHLTIIKDTDKNTRYDIVESYGD